MMRMMKRRIFLLLLVVLCTSVTYSQQQESARLWINGSKGRLAAILQMPERITGGKKTPIVILMHGYGGNKEAQMLSILADSLQAKGIGSIRFDFNSHGESEGATEEMTVPNEIEDARCVYNYLKTMPDIGKIALAGHSQGGVVASMLAGELGSKAVAAVTLFAPAAVLREDAIRGNTFGVPYNPLDPPPFVTIGNRNLGRNYILTAFSLPIYETAARYKGHVCLIHGTGDRIAPYSYSERYHSVWKKSELHLLRGADHGFYPVMPEVIRISTAFFCKTLL